MAENLTLLIQQLVKSQTEQSNQLAQALSAITNNQPNRQNADLFSTINSQLSEFIYEPEVDFTFQIWYERFGPFIESDGQVLPDDMKVRLLVGKLGTKEYGRYTESILPKRPTEFQFQETIQKMLNLFCGTKSIFVRRYECLQLFKAPSQSPLDFAAQVSASCERARMELTKEEIKSLIFISGLGDGDRDLRERSLKLLEDARIKNESIRFDKLVEECRSVLSLRSSAAALAHSAPWSNSTTNSISARPQRVHERSRSRGPNPFQRSRHPERSGSRPRTLSTQSGRSNHSQSSLPPYPCKYCQKMHWVSECDKNPNRRKFDRRAQPVTHFRQGYKGKMESMSVMSIGNPTEDWISIKCQINHHPVSLMVDTGSRLTIIQTSLWEEIGKPALIPVQAKGRSYSGHQFEITGSFQCQVTVENATRKLECFVTAEGMLNLFGLPWIRAFEKALQRPIATTLPSQPTTISTVGMSVNDAAQLSAHLREAFPKVFASGLGHCNKMKAHLFLKADAIPVFCRARPVPHGAQSAIDEELDRLLGIGAIKQIDFSRWAAPIVAVKKKNGATRVCIDFSTGLNDRLELNRHPLPRPDDIFAALRGTSVFSQIDFKDAYLQIELDEESKQLVGLNTHRGLFQCQRLPFGVKSAPSIFQKLMDELVSGVDGVFGYLDDFIVATSTVQQHVSVLNTFFNRIQDWGLRVNLDKCNFLRPKLKFLGHIISAEGIRPDPSRSEAIRSMPAPSDQQTLRSFLGAINYYSRFVQEMRHLRAPLDQLLAKDVPWTWGPEQQQAFQKAKDIFQSDLLLTHYDPNKPITVAADASKSGIGATISHTFPNGKEKVVEHASRSLSDAERNYSQIEKEALGLIFAVQKFHRMIYGRQFTLLTDHKPLLSIFGSKSGIPIYTASRLQRWALILSNYQFNIKYISTKNFGQVDVLSRLIAQCRESRNDEDHVIAVAQNEQRFISDDGTSELEFSVAAVACAFQANIEQLPVTSAEVAQHTRDDNTLQQVLNFCRQGWTKDAREVPELKPYFTNRLWLSEIQGCLLLGDRVIIPPSLRQRLLATLHFSHPGIGRMKSLARNFIYWPKLDLDIERWVRGCTDCASAAKRPQKVPLQPWPTTNKAYERLHMDFAGPCADGHTYFIMVDSYSKWPEVIKMTKTTSQCLITQLEWLFTRYGLPQELVSDNGPQFKSEEFSHFCRTNGIKHTFTPPFHPQSNGLAERFVDTFKRQMQKHSRSEGNWVQKALFAYRSTPNETLEGRTPAELFLGRPLRTVLSLIKPSNDRHTTNSNRSRQMAQQFDKRHGAKDRKFTIGDTVQIINYRQNKRVWLQGQILGGSGVVWKVNVPTLGVVVTRHSNQMRSFVPVPYTETRTVPTVQDQPPEQPEGSPPRQRRVRFADEPEEEPPMQERQSPVKPPQEVRRSTRQRRPPHILSPDHRAKHRYDLRPRDHI